MSNFSLVRFVLILSLIGLSSCATDYDPKRAKTVTGVDIGKRQWKTITDSESVMYILNPPLVSRIRANEGVIGRYQEGMNFVSGGFIFYEQLANGLNTRYGIKEMTMDIVRVNRVFKMHAVTTEIEQIKERIINGINYAYVFMPGKTRDCFIIYAFFGNASYSSSNSSGDQAVRGIECLKSRSSTPSNIQKKWFDLLERIRFDGPKPGWTSTATVTQNEVDVLRRNNMEILVTSGGFTKKELEAFMSKIIKEYKNISEYIGRGSGQTFLWKIGTDRRIVSWRCGIPITVFVQPFRVRNNIVPVSESITHCLAGTAYKRLWGIGFRVYMQEKFGTNPAFPANGEDLHKLSNSIINTSLYWKNKKPISYILTAPNVLIESGTNERRQSRIIAGSFSKFLIEEILNEDMDKYMKIYQTDDLSATRSTIHQLEDKWLKLIRNKTS